MTAFHNIEGPRGFDTYREAVEASRFLVRLRAGEFFDERLPLSHDLRHHGATMALNRGFTAPIVMALGGWKTERMMRRYAAVTDATLRAAAEAVSGRGNGNAAWERAANPAL